MLKVTLCINSGEIICQTQLTFGDNGAKSLKITDFSKISAVQSSFTTAKVFIKRRAHSTHRKSNPPLKFELEMFNRQLSILTQIAEITDHLYLCAARAVDLDAIKRYGITCVVNATVELPNNLLIPTLDYIRVAIEDSPTANIAFHFDEIADKINCVRLCGGKTLVHCVAGVSRSASLCISYLMKYQKMSLMQAYHHVKDRRPIVRPNNGFFRQLIEYEKKLCGGRESVRLIPSDLGMIPEVYANDYKHFVSIMGGNSTPNSNSVVSKISCIKVGKQRP
ncbi:hypothetical protein CHUAL_007889 [Chamberlinius hualienensis]